MKDIQHKRVLSHLWIMWAALLAIFLLSYAGSQPVQAATSGTAANNIILFIGDGMGPEHVEAGGLYTNGAAGTLVFESFPNQTTMTHLNASGTTTDSAASATAMATGVKVYNGVISIANPGDGSDLQTLLEIYKGFGQDKNTGLVTTSYITDASPAAFGAHESSRSNKSQIFDDYILRAKPTLFLGGGGNGFNSSEAQSEDYEVVTNRSDLSAIFTESAKSVAGGFGSGEIPAAGMFGRDDTLPTLPEMTETALNILDNDPDGFFLVVEHEGTDNYSHAWNTEGMVRSVKELDAAVQAAVDWMALNPDTLILVTADHETGGLTVPPQDTEAGEIPTVDWSTTGHTNTRVPVYATGVGAAQVVDGVVIDNTNIFTIMGPAAAGETPHDLVDWIWSGAVTHNSAVVNARVKSSADVNLLLSEFNDLSSPTTIGPLPADSGNNNTVSFDLSGLTADRRYHYAIKIGDEVDGLHRGTFRTFPAGAFSFAFAISGDAEQGSNLPVFDVVREEQTSFFVSPGDFMYSDIGVDNVNLYRSAFADTLSASRQSELYRNLPIAYMWDDHDYADDNEDKDAPSRDAAREAYQEIVPHYPLGAVSAAALNKPDVAGFDNVPIYQSFTVGRAYFIMTDLRSERDPGGSMMGDDQKKWFMNELKNARKKQYTPIFWLSSVPWIAAADSGADHWAGYHAERVEIANFIKTNDIQNVVILSADAHMIALDDGTNSDYATGGGAPMPVFQAAALDRGGSIKGGPYSHGAYRNEDPYISQYALVQVTDTGVGDVGVRYIGKRLTASDTVTAFMSTNAVAEQVPLDWSTTLTVPPPPTAVTLREFSAATERTAVAPAGLLFLAAFGLILGMLQIISIRRTA